jgi:hypothetical protein
MSETATDSNLVRHAREELTRAGLFDADSDYDGMLGRAVLELVEKFAAQGHSGASAYMVIDLTQRLVSFEPLTPLTSDPQEWQHIAESMVGQPDLWQSRRRPDAFSNDGGKTYKITGVDEVHTSA